MIKYIFTQIYLLFWFFKTFSIQLELSYFSRETYYHVTENLLLVGNDNEIVNSGHVRSYSCMYEYEFMAFVTVYRNPVQFQARPNPSMERGGWVKYHLDPRRYWQSTAGRRAGGWKSVLFMHVDIAGMHADNTPVKGPMSKLCAQ